MAGTSGNSSAAARLAVGMLALLSWPACALDISRDTVEPESMKDEHLGDAMYKHEKNYFIGGHGKNGGDAKFQFSLKARIGYQLYFGFTQTSIWDLSEPSAPFQDSSYRPAFFYYQPPEKDRLSFSAGLEHESNGRAGAASRSIWTTFFQSHHEIATAAGNSFHVIPRLYAYISREDTNRDIADYRGFAQLGLRYRGLTTDSRDGNFEAGVLARAGRDFDRGSLQIDLSWPMPKCTWKWLCGGGSGRIPGYVYAQAFSGYGETLLDYNRSFGTTFRIGYMLTRDR